MKELFMSVFAIIFFLCSLYFGLLFISVALTILLNGGHFAFALSVFIVMLISGIGYNTIANL